MIPRFLVSTSALLLGLVPLQASDQAQALNRATDLVSQWTGDQRLYVKGNLGVPARQLDELESWLDRKGENWIILLLRDTAGERFEQADGRSFQGVEAVERAANIATRNQTGFGQLKDTRSGETNGAIFILFLRERTFSYSGGDAHDRRGLGSSSWKGNLDRPAFRAMSNGGRIVDAVKGTVTEVNQRLDRQFSLEQKRRRQELAEAKQRAANAQQLLEEARTDLATLTQNAAEFRESGGERATGDLARPPVQELEARLQQAADALNAGDAATASTQAGSVRDFCQAQNQLLRDYEEAPEKFEATARELAALVQEDSGWAGDRFMLAKNELATARTLHAQGQSAYADHHQASIKAMMSGRAAILEGQALAEARAKRRQALRTLALVVTLTGAGVLAWILYWLNRRRQSVLQRAIERFESWNRGAQQQTSDLFGLLDRASLLIGSSADLKERGYTGITQQLSEQVIEDIDELFIMSSSVRRILDDTRKLLFPGSPVLRLINLLSGDRYEQALRRLDDEPIRFQPEDGIEPILRGEQEEPERMLGELQAHQSFSLSFQELITACNQHASRANEALETLEESWSTVHETLEELQSEFEALSNTERRLSTEASHDGYFPMLSLFEAALPAAQDHLDAAVTQSTVDPVGALQGPASVARRILDNGRTLADAILSAREVMFPELRATSNNLEESGAKTGWIGRQLDELTDWAQKIALDAVESDMGVEIKAFTGELEGILDRAQTALKLRLRSRGVLQKEIETVAQSVTSTRKSLGQKLGIPAKRILRESGLDPDERLEEASRQHAAADAALDRGGVAAAEAALDRAKELVDDALALVAITRQSQESHEDKVKERVEHQGAIEEEIPRLQNLLHQLQEQFLPTALCPVATDPESTIEDNLAEAKSALQEAGSLVAKSKDGFGEGLLIQSAAQLEQAGNWLTMAQGLLREIEDWHQHLEELVAETTFELERAGQRIHHLRDQIKDPRTMEATLEAFSRQVEELTVLQELDQAGRKDPVELSTRLHQLREDLSNTKDRQEADWKLHEEAQRSLIAARSQWVSAREWARRASDDNIPDSPAIMGLRQQIEELGFSLEEAESVLRQAHRDWTLLDAEADRIHTEAGRATAELKEELQQAEEAVSAISAAATQVRRAASWTGSYGVTIRGTPGATPLARARNHLLRGQYYPALRSANEAKSNAERAVTAALAMVAQRRRAEQRRREEARRRAAERRRASTFSRPSSFGGFGGGSSSMGRSTFSGGSGMGRSGW